MATDFEKQFGDYGSLTDSLGLGPAAMASGQYPNRAEESQATRIMRLLGKGATFGLDTSQTPIEAENIGEHVAEFAGSIPSTIGATAIAGPALGAVVPGFARLAPLAKHVGTAGALGAGIGTGKAIQSGDITNIPSETAWWAGSELAGQGLLRGGAKLLGKGTKIAPSATQHGPTAPTATEREFWQAIETQNKVDKGNVINRILNPDDLSSTVPGERVVIPSQGPRTFLPPPEIPRGLTDEGPAVRWIKVGDEGVDFDEIPDLVLDTPLGARASQRKMIELHRAEAPGTTGETFTTDRTQAFSDAKKVGGYLKSIEIPEEDLVKYQSGKGYRVPSKVQKEVGVGEHQPQDIPYYEKEVAKGAKLQPREPRKPIEMTLEDEFGNPVAPRPLGPLTEGQAARESFPAPTDPNSIPFRLSPSAEPAIPIYKPIRRPSLDNFVEKSHENPIMAENMAKPLKEIVDSKTGTTMVAPKTARASYVMDMAGKITRNIEPPISASMREDIVKPLNKAKLDHGIQVEQYKTSNLLKKSEDEIERITKDAEGRLVVKPIQFKSIVEDPVSQRITRNLARQGMTTNDMKAFVAQKAAEYEALSPMDKTAYGGKLGPMDTRKKWLKAEIANELKRRGPC